MSQATQWLVDQHDPRTDSSGSNDNRLTGGGKGECQREDFIVELLPGDTESSPRSSFFMTGGPTWNGSRVDGSDALTCF